MVLGVYLDDSSDWKNNIDELIGSLFMPFYAIKVIARELDYTNVRTV